MAVNDHGRIARSATLGLIAGRDGAALAFNAAASRAAALATAASSAAALAAACNSLAAVTSDVALAAAASVAALAAMATICALASAVPPLGSIVALIRSGEAKASACGGSGTTGAPKSTARADANSTAANTSRRKGRAIFVPVPRPRASLNSSKSSPAIPVRGCRRPAPAPPRLETPGQSRGGRQAWPAVCLLAPGVPVGSSTAP